MKIIKKIKSIPLTYQKHGIDGLIYAFLRNLNIKTKYNSIIDKKKNYIEKKIIKITNKNVINGIYKSTKLNFSTHWGGFDTSSKLLGIYEEQVQKKISELKQKFDLKHIVNFGAGDGYHIIGLIKNKYFENGLAFEINSKGKKIIEENLFLNNLNDKIKIFGKANFINVKKNINDQELKKTLFLVDIEGDEFTLFNSENLENFKKSVLIIENHDFLIKNKKIVEDFFSLMEKYFNLEILENGARNPYLIPEIKDLDDDERWLIVSEGRKLSMNWLIFTPK